MSGSNSKPRKNRPNSNVNKFITLKNEVEALKAQILQLKTDAERNQDSNSAAYYAGSADALDHVLGLIQRLTKT